MSEHTPGPWSLMDTSSWSLEQRRNGPSSVCHVGDFTIVTDGPSYEFHGTDEADARLVAAAPAMLEALRELLVSHDNMYRALFGERSEPADDIAAKPARAAIAKATCAPTVSARTEG
jgi:hypothetical protein